MRERRRGGRVGARYAPPRDDQAAEPDAEQEYQQDQRERVRGPADDHDEDASPGDFVEQRCKGGDSQENEGECPELISGRSRNLFIPGLALGVRQTPPAAESDRGRTDREVDGGRRPERELHADELDQEKARERRAHHGAERVQAIEPAERRLEQAPIFAGERPGQHGECAAHERRRNEQHQGCQPKSQRNTGAAAEREGSGGTDIEPVRETEHQW